MTATVLPGRKETRLLLLFHIIDSCLLLTTTTTTTSLFRMPASSLAHIKSNAIVPQPRLGAMDAVCNPFMLLKSLLLQSLHFVAREREGKKKASSFGRPPLLCLTLSLLPAWLPCFWWVEVYSLEICFKKRFVSNLSALQEQNKGGKKHTQVRHRTTCTDYNGNCMTEGCCKGYKW